MAERANTHLSEQIEAAFAWWREAGVDYAFGDEVTNWLAGQPTSTRPRPQAGQSLSLPHEKDRRFRTAPPGEDSALEAQPSLPAIDTTGLPQDLIAFREWWLTEPSLDNGRLTGRVAPRGASEAELMIVVPEPEREDEQRLLSGPQGRLLEAMIVAMGLPPDTIYLASVLPRHTPMADWSLAAALGLGGILHHHIRLAAPRRLLLLGGNALSLLGNDLPNSGQILSQFNHDGASIPLMGATDLGVLLVRPRAKDKVWQQWLDWTGPDSTGLDCTGIAKT